MTLPFRIPAEPTAIPLNRPTPPTVRLPENRRVEDRGDAEKPGASDPIPSDPMPSGSAPDYEDLRQRATRLVELGEYEEALLVLDAAVDVAVAAGDEVLADRAACNRSAVALEIGSPERQAETLLDVLARSADVENAWAAANALARISELRSSYKKGIFYARIARDRAQWLGREDWLAHAHNRLGNLLLAESHVAEATAEYEQAMELIPHDPPVWRAQVLDNVGYCRVLDGRLEEGLSLLYQSLRLLLRAEAHRHRISCHLDLAFALLEAERFRYSWVHAEKAVALAERYDDPESVKNGLYLLGEAQLKAEATDLADATFSRLQRLFFPENPQVCTWLREVDLRQVVNLRA